MQDGDRYNPNDLFESLQFGDDFNPFGLFAGIFIPEALAQSIELSPGSKLAYGRLARYAGRDGECFPAAETLGREIGLGERQTRRYLSELEELSLIRCIRRGSTSNAYRFRWHPVFRSIRVRPDRSDVSGHDRSDVSGLTGQMCPPKRVSEESQVKESHLNINNREDAGPPPKLLSEDEWPQTTALVQGRFLSVDSRFMSRLIHAAVHGAISAGGVAAELTDERLAWMVKEILKNPKIYSAGLLLTAVPQAIENLIKRHAKLTARQEVRVVL